MPNVLPTDWEYDVNYKWTRPTEWLDLNVPDGVPEKIIALVAVYPNDERPAQKGLCGDGRIQHRHPRGAVGLPEDFLFPQRGG